MLPAATLADEDMGVMGNQVTACVLLDFGSEVKIDEGVRACQLRVTLGAGDRFVVSDAQRLSFVVRMGLGASIWQYTPFPFLE